MISVRIHNPSNFSGTKLAEFRAFARKQLRETYGGKPVTPAQAAQRLWGYAQHEGLSKREATEIVRSLGKKASGASAGRKKGKQNMARKKKKGGARSKKRRTAAQKAATARMLAARKAQLSGGGKKRRSGGKRRSKKRHHAAKSHSAPKRTRTRRKTHRRKAAAYVCVVPKTKARRGCAGGAHVRKGSKMKRRKNPGRRHHRKASHRRRRRNPSLPFFAQVLLGAGAGLAAGIAVTALPRAFMPGKAPLLTKVGAILGAGAGVWLAKKHPLIGAGVAAGAIAGAVQNTLSAKVETMLAPSSESAQARLTGFQYLEGMGAVAADMGAVAADMGALPTSAYDMGDYGYMNGIGNVG